MISKKNKDLTMKNLALLVMVISITDVITVRDTDLPIKTFLPIVRTSPWTVIEFTD